MKFTVRYSYNLDLLNLMNVLTGEEFYVNWHKNISKLFGEQLSDYSKSCVKEAVEIMGSAMLGPYLSLVVSAVPNFEKRTITRMFSNTDFLRERFANFSYYDDKQWPDYASVFSVLLPVVNELESNGFHEYWKKVCLPSIRRVQRQFRAYANKFQLDKDIEYMLGPGQAPGSITVFLSALSAPHGIKICGPQYITDIAFPKKASLVTAIHEMFHPPYSTKDLEQELEQLGKDPLLKHAFETKDPRFGYSTMDGFIEENVVEAMAIFICNKVGLEDNPMEYFAKHDDGSHMFSVVLYDYFHRYPKSGSQAFQAYFRELLQKMPVGSLDREYREIQSSACPEL